MKIKRRMAASSAFIALAIVIAGVASAGQKSIIPLKILSRTPFFTFMVIITCLSLIAVAVMAITMWHRSNTSCENTACSFHPRYKGVNKGYDFSSISTPEEFLTVPRETRQSDGEDNKKEWTRKNQFRIPQVGVTDPRNNLILTGGAACPLEPPLKKSEGPAPQSLVPDGSQSPDAKMEFTDEMVVKVIERLRRQEDKGFLQAS